MNTNKVRIPSGTTHISLDERGRGWIDGTNFRVDQVVADAIGTNKYTPQEILEAHPDCNLTLARVHAAMAWYYDHQAEMDAEFEREHREYEEALAKQRQSPEHQQTLARWAKRAAELVSDGKPVA
jgi:uncharacterized protein (DUF433 family)